MKNTISKIIAILFIATIFTSCSIDMFNRVNGNRNVTTQVRKIADKFTEIKVSNGIDLYITQGSKNNVTVEADENLHDIIISEVEDEILKIYSKKNIWKAKARKVYVTVKYLTFLKATSGSDIVGKETVKTDEISILATSGARINIKITATSVETSSTSGSEINISGTATNHATSASSGASINAYQLESKNVLARATSGAEINVYASEKLDVKATSGGNVDFKGNPKLLNKKASSGGSVSEK